MYLGEMGLGKFSGKSFKKAAKPLARVSHVARAVGSHSTRKAHAKPVGLSGWEDDAGLGKFKLKNVVKSVTKAVTQVAKVAVTPIAVAASSSLNAVGLRNAANAVNKAVSVSAAENKLLNKGAQAAGWGIDAGALVVGGVMAAPAIASASGTIGSTLAAGAKLLPKAIPLVSSFFGKKTASSSDAAPKATDAAAPSYTQQVENSLVSAGKRYLEKAVDQGGSSSADGSAATTAATAAEAGQASTEAASAPKKSSAWLALLPIGALAIL